MKEPKDQTPDSESIGKVRSYDSLKFLLAHGRHSTNYRAKLLGRTIAGDDNLAERLVVLAKCDSHIVASLHGLFLHTDVGDFERCASRCTDREVTVNVGNGSGCLRAYDLNRCADNRLTVFRRDYFSGNARLR